MKRPASTLLTSPLSLLAATLVTAAFATGCTASTPVEPAVDESGDNTVEGAGTTVAQAAANNCATSSVKGLSKQIIAEARCVDPDAYATVPDLGNVTFISGVFSTMEKPAKDHLVSALKAKSGTSMTVNSMLRTIAQQYMLYNWYQSGRCGIGLAAKPGNSNHETGLAIDVSQYSTWKATLQANGFHWLGSSDAVHFDYAGAGAKDYRGLDVKAFQRLWNRNHPSDKITVDGDWGPQTEARMKKAPAGGFETGATCASAPQYMDEAELMLQAADEAEARHAEQAAEQVAAHDVQLASGTVEVCTSVTELAPAANDEACSHCFDTICQNDPYCCDTEWDDRCVATGMQICEALCGKDAGQQ